MKKFFFAVLALVSIAGTLSARETYNFNLDWRMKVGQMPLETVMSTKLSDGEQVSLPHALNEGEAFRVRQNELTQTVAWYYKKFTLPPLENKRVLIEFEGARQATGVYVNGQAVGMSENGVMAFGFDLTPYVKAGENEIAVCVDNRSSYKEASTGTNFQWNDMTFNANYGGLTKNVKLHIADEIYQTLPLYSNLRTTGTYVYGSDYDVAKKEATVNIESEIKNTSGAARKIACQAEVLDADGKQVALFTGEAQEVAAGATVTLKASNRLSGLHFWSWGYGYLYTVRTSLIIDGKVSDPVETRTGFRKTKFAEGKIWLNDRVIMMKGYAQRTTNEWPYVGNDLPAWMSDYSNHLMVEDNANLVRWMHITPSKQDVESCDRVGLIQAMPAGDHEGDAKGRQWEQRVELMRDAIIYNRNNPSIFFYECGNESISREHMVEMVKVRDQYDPNGGRAIGSREMLDIQEAEYGGEMLYINKSGLHPVWAMEYCRDEGYRMYWDNLSYPYHQHGNGPYLKKAPVPEYNQNQDMLTVEQVKRWYDYWRVRPGMGKRVSSGGVKICFTDTNTHNRSEFTYRVSGVMDPMRIEKAGYRAHQVMWDGWVDNEKKASYIIGHWNYIAGVKKDIYVISNSPRTELYVNKKRVGEAHAQYHFLHVFKNVEWVSGSIRVVGTDEAGNVESEDRIETAGRADHIALTLIQNPKGTKADGSDIAMVQVEIVDKQGRRLPLDNRFITFETEGPCEWIGGLAKSQDLDNFIGSKMLPVECGINRVMIRSTREAGKVTVKASAKGLAPQSITFDTQAITDNGGLSDYIVGKDQPLRLEKGETPQTPSYREFMRTIDIASATAGYDAEHANRSFDDNELSEWKNDGHAETGWITYELKEEAAIEQIDVKFTGWRSRSYPIEVYADKQLVWQGKTETNLGYTPLIIKNPVKAKTYTVKLVGTAINRDGFSGIVEVVEPVRGELDLYKAVDGDKVRNELRIVEIDFLQNVK